MAKQVKITLERLAEIMLEGFEEVKTDIAEMNRDVKEVRKDVSEMKSDVVAHAT